MDHQLITIAVVGLGEFGQKCLDALADLPAYKLIAVGDRDSRLAEQTGKTRGADFFTDHRRLLSGAKPQVLIVATPPAASADLVRMAAKNGVHVVKPAPLARTLAEGADLVSRMDQAGLTFAVLSPRRFGLSYRSLMDGQAALGPLFLARAQYMLNWSRQFGWRGDQAGAGGGVLLEAGYEMVDLLVCAMGLPEDAYAITGRRGRPHMIATDEHHENLGIYDTDDTAVVALRFAGGAIGTVIASWVTSPAIEQLTLHGQAGSAMADPVQCVFRDVGGQVTRRVDGEVRLPAALAEQLTMLADTLAGGNKQCLSSAREHLLTLSVVEAAYLSDRTGSPESPQRLLASRGLTPDECRPGDNADIVSE